MKNIIVGIDFSSCSLNAIKHAVSLAVNLKANLTLVYCLTPDAKIIEETSTTLKSNILSIAEKNWMNIPIIVKNTFITQK